jgi:hypothetical protein
VIVDRLLLTSSLADSECVMSEMDPFADQYSDLLDGTYDSVDRIVLNGYFAMASSPGGFRIWWRSLFGTDDNLDHACVMRFSGRFGRRLRAWAKHKGVPVMDATSGDGADRERTHQQVEKLRPSDESFTGVFCITVHRAPAPLWEVTRYGNGGIDIRRKPKRSWVNHYAFHIVDPQWGHVTIKLCGHPPFPAQVILNGHEYVAQQLSSCGIGATMEGNCFTNTSNAAGLSRCAETLCSPSTVGRLQQVCERWIYSSCLCFALDLEEQRRSGFRYNYSVYQVEYSRNYLFAIPRRMEEVFQEMIDRTRRSLDIPIIRTLFGRKHRPYMKVGKKSPRFEVVVERPVYNMTVFKVHFERLTLKSYTKGARVLRVEAIAHNTADLHCGKVLEKWPEIISRLAQMVDRFTGVLRGASAAWITESKLETLPEPSQIGQSRVAGIDVNKPRMRAVIQAVMALATLPKGFRAGDLAAKVTEIIGHSYTPRQAAYDLKKLRAKQIVERIASSQRYQPSHEGLRAIAALTVLREKILKPLLTNRGKLPKAPLGKDPIIHHYQNLRREMRQLFHRLGLAA